MRAARRVALVVAVLFAAIAANAQKSPNIELGFKADKQYHLTDLDAVNLFNGNLTVTIPLGLKYQVGPTLSYQFLLSYNSKAWDYHKYEDAVGTEYREGEVNLRSNAGMGWRLSFGRLISPDDYTALFPDYMSGWSYEGPAGDEHSFSGPADVGISRDTSSLRLVKVSDTQRDVEFPNGEVHEFTREHGHYRLKKMRDNLGNAVTISYVYDADRPYQWSITDTIGRQHAVYFTPFVMTDDTFDRGEHLSAISMATADVNVPAMYYFGVQTKTVTYGAQHHPRPVVLGGPEGTTVSLPFLTSITLPDSSVFALSYYDTYSDTGALKDWTVPTGGKTTYTYDTYALPGDGCFDTPVTTQSLGVVSRTTIDGTTDYVHRLGPGVILDWHGSHPCGIGPDVVGPVAPTRWSRTSVLSPILTVDGVQSRMRTDSYFHAWMMMGGYSPADRLAADTVDADYGAPFVTGAPSKTVAMSPFTPWYDSGVDNDVDARDDANDAAPRYLSTQVMNGCAPDLSGDCRSGMLRRSSFLRYERQPIVLTSQTPLLSIAWLKSSRAVFEDDANCASALCYTQSLSSDWDGLSHYRMMTTTSNFPGETSTAATTWTNYRGIASPADASVLWQANLYDETVTTETNGPTYRAYACFDPSTGFLRQSRAIADRSSAAAPGSADVVKVMTADAQGNAATEKSYGGDSQTVPVPASAADDCATALVDTNGQALPPQYSIGYTYNAAGAMQTMQYYDLTGVAFPFKTVDRVIEPRTGQPMAVRDTAGVATVYTYDKKPARLMSVAPATGHATSYTYTNANGTVPAMVEFATDGAAESLGAVRGNVQFDAMGRVVREARVTPNGMWSVVQSLYDALGRKWQVSEPQAFSTVPTAEFTPVAVTSIAFDSFGRPASTTAPDGSVATATYAGTRAIARTACVVTGVSDAGCAGNTTLSGQERVTTTETYDSRGRLVQVDEPTGGTVAKYGYDPAGRLASVYMAASGIAQSRTFAYDGRGFMTAETHPEKGSTGGGAIFYSGFDSHGHATRQRDGSATSAIDLTFVYDAADRLTSVAETGGNVVKTFSFWTANAGADKKLGKIATASRHNHIIIGGADRDVVVTDTYEYAEPGGRMTAKTTSVASGATIQTFRMEYAYNTLGDIASVVYPTCVFACSGMPSVNTVTNGYTNGGLTTVNGFATIGYDDNGRISHVQHQGANAANTAGSDEQVNTLSRISNIKYTGLTDCALPATPVINSAGRVCAGQNGVASIAAPESTTTYIWTISGGALTGATTGNNVTYTAGPAGTVQVSVVASNTCGSVSAAPVFVAITAAPSTPQISAPASVCASQVVVASISAPQSGTVYSWSVSGGTAAGSATGTSFSCTAGASGTVQLNVVATNTCGQASAAPANVPITTSPATPIIASASTVCPSQNAVASVASPISGVTYTWNVLGGTINGPTSGNSVSYTSGASGTIQLNVVAVGTCGQANATPVTVAIQSNVAITQQPAGASIFAGSGVTLTIAASGGGLTYQWYRGARSDVSNPIAGATQASYRAQPAVTTVYWVRVASSTCGGFFDSNAATVTVTSPLPGATGLTATTQTNTSSVLIQWNGVTGASSYRVSRFGTLGGSPTILAPTPAGTSFSDSPPATTTPVAYLYVVNAIDSNGNISPTVSNLDYAVVATPSSLFTDEPLALTTDPAGPTVIRGRHVRELRDAIDGIRMAAGLSPVWLNVAAPTGVIMANDFLSLQTRLNEARSALGLTAWAWTGVAAPSASSRGAVFGAHIQQLRGAVR